MSTKKANIAILRVLGLAETLWSQLDNWTTKPDNMPSSKHFEALIKNRKWFKRWSEKKRRGN